MPEDFKEQKPSPQDLAKTASQGSWKVARPQDNRLGGKWWERFGDPDLNVLEERVRLSNQSIILAEANYREAHALEAEARAGLLPTASVAPSITRAHFSQSTTAAGAGPAVAGSNSSGTSGEAGQTRTEYSLPLNASYEIDLWGRVRNTVAQSAYTAQASAADLATAILSTQAELAQDYFELRAADEQRQILDTTLADYQASIHLVYTLFRSGLASDEDVAEANTQLDSAQAEATDLGIVRAQYEHAIAVLLGLPPSRFSIPVKGFNPRPPAVPLALPADLLERRPDIAAAERRTAAANAGIGIARAAYFPTVSLTGTFGFDSFSFSQWLDWPNRYWSIGPTAAETVFDGGLRRAQTRAAWAEYDQSVATYRQTVLSALQAVEDDLVSLRILSDEAVQQHAAADAARRTVELSVARYKLGIDSYVNVITAQNAFLTNRLAELQVQLRRLTSTIGLINNLGGGWDTGQYAATEHLATHPESSKGPVEGETAQAEPNPPALAGPPAKPEELLKQDQDAMAPVASPVQGTQPSQP